MPSEDSLPVDSTAAFPLSQAHEKSRFAVVDPLYSATELVPEPDIQEHGAQWLYGDAELECWRLQVLRQRMEAAKLKVGYPGTFHKPSTCASFQLTLRSGQRLPSTIDLRAVGDIVVSLGERVIYRGAASDALHCVLCPDDSATGTETLRVDISTQGAPPALLIVNGPLCTGLAPWHWSADGIHFTPACAFPQTHSGLPPHRLELQETPLSPVSREGELFDFGCELLGRISFCCASQPTLFVGESPAEAHNSDPQTFEQSCTLHPNGEGCWISEHALAFRYARITNGEPADLKCLALFHPAQYRGAFACSDERLTRIWMNSAYTLRLCLHDFLIDGVKRDRLPWTGDMAMSLMANAYTFGDADIVRRSLTALGRAGIEQTHINGIVDYSMWWLIAQDHYQQYFGDMAHLQRDWSRIKDTLERLAARCGADGLFVTTSNEWLFIDWVSDNKLTALQILWWWALRSGADIAVRMGDEPTAARWRANADTLEATLYSRAWDAQTNTWRGLPDNNSECSRHANLLAVVSGLAKTNQKDGILALLLGNKANPVGTPYMAGFENIALGRLGGIDAMLQRVNCYWGAMIDRGATTFWEAYNVADDGDQAYAFYNRPFAKSLCHAWSAGPASFLPAEIFGLRPTADGWARFSVDPRLGTLQWACATVPTPHGDIEVAVDIHSMTLRLPAGTAAQWREYTFTGPGYFSQDL